MSSMCAFLLRIDKLLCICPKMWNIEVDWAYPNDWTPIHIMLSTGLKLIIIVPTDGLVSNFGWPSVISQHHIDRFMQERCNSSALAVELCLSCTKPWICKQKTCLVTVCKESVNWNLCYVMTGWKIHGQLNRDPIPTVQSRHQSIIYYQRLKYG